MQKKKSYTIDPKEYEEDGLFYEDDAFELNQRGEDESSKVEAYRFVDRKKAPRAYESPKAEARRLRQEAFYMRRRIQKLEAFRKRAKAYDAHYMVNLSTIEYVKVYSPYGCKEAFTELQQDLEDAVHSDGLGKLADYSKMDTWSLQVAKSYFIYSPNPYAGMDLLLEDLKMCRLEKLGFHRHTRTTVGCLLLNGNEYVFFWPKLLKDQEEDCSLDPTTDTQSEGL